MDSFTSGSKFAMPISPDAAQSDPVMEAPVRPTRQVRESGMMTMASTRTPVALQDRPLAQIAARTSMQSVDGLAEMETEARPPPISTSILARRSLWADLAQTANL